MIKASALYIVIIIALVIAVLCSSLIVAGYFYKIQYQRKFRGDLLYSNVCSGTNILLAEDEHSYSSRKVSLFGGDQDSVILKRINWGLYDVAVAQAFIHNDTLTKIFSTGYLADSAKWAALYLIDEDRPISVSGKTLIKGEVFIPKAGIKEAYVDNMAYQGDKKLVDGLKKTSDKKLPVLTESSYANLKKLLSVQADADSSLAIADSMFRSFDAPLKLIGLGKQAIHLRKKMDGYILIRSDTTITIDNTSILDHVIIFARSVNVESGFKGNCQLFASDSIHIQSNCHFNYPSVIGLLSQNQSKNKEPGKIIIDSATTIDGTVFSYDPNASAIRPVIILGSQTTVNGQIYSQGILSYKKNVAVNGSVMTNRFIYQSGYTMYENYLINFRVNSVPLSKYYLTSELLPFASTKRRVLEWLK
ncbi:hypothetical protein [Mucilaginibacter jinjuensis]|uniref:Cytoskeletal protein CcmA (Bactofilin family) n=1 Tax=Mucilaginibacter jinjuensis TaxID=1176721 RepID=A0ABY7TCE3_9SPHI|nr:hypothetical protein [Mucilaginibacter jinjuensis]WCT13656.1 hypothetical protein PQO05_06870 [Mucilaginibacter jinjuensis]